MINQKSLDAVSKSSFGKNFCKPLYDSYCFSRIPATIKYLLTGSGTATLPKDTFGGADQFDNVVLLLIDGFGWQFFEKYSQKYPFLKRFIDAGIASKITSQFPSTTANHVTCINTGLTVGQSGVYEWFYYEPLLDRMIAPLLFSFAGDREINTLNETGISPSQLFPTRTLYQELKEKKVKSYVVQHDAIAYSPYSQTLCSGAEQVPYHTFTDGLKNILKICEKGSSGPSYFCLYFGDIDSAGHRHGIDSPQFENAVDECWKTMEEIFWTGLQKTKKKTACILIADHGMVPVNPKTTIYLNQEISDIDRFFKKNRQGESLVPAGSCRDFFLHIKDEMLGEAQEFLANKFKKCAEVYLTKELIEKGFFGQKRPSKDFLSRVGNLVILPYENEAIWWYEKHRFEQHFYAAHGGLTRSEMETIFLFMEI
ncbi:MAG TPA: alkaline phosphatase family protein [Rhabdochlamydiaceae bacterium]|nr:alkaline phosphatase family protein [Rhabdochlamydiaceae bacterium]